MYNIFVALQFCCATYSFLISKRTGYQGVWGGWRQDLLICNIVQELDASNRYGQPAVEPILRAAVKNGRVRDFIDVLDKRDWKDALRPIYEALPAVETGSAEYLKRIAIEIRTPATEFLRRIAPDLADLPARGE